MFKVPVDIVRDVVRVSTDVVRDRRQLLQEASLAFFSTKRTKLTAYNVEKRLIICRHDGDGDHGQILQYEEVCEAQRALRRESRDVKCRETRDHPQASIFLLPHLSALHRKLAAPTSIYEKVTYTSIHWL